MPKTITITVPDVHIDRIKEMFRKTLGRDLTPAEMRYLGLSHPIISIEKLELSESGRYRGKVKVLKKKLIERKLA